MSSFAVLKDFIRANQHHVSESDYTLARKHFNHLLQQKRLLTAGSIVDHFYENDFADNSLVDEIDSLKAEIDKKNAEIKKIIYEKGAEIDKKKMLKSKQLRNRKIC